MAILFFIITCIALLSGFPVALVLAGMSLIAALIGTLLGIFDSNLLSAMPSRIYYIMTKGDLLSVPLFIFMGIMLEKSRIAENLLSSMATLFGRTRGGLGFSVTIVGMLLAASTGIVGATVVTMGLLSLRSMLKHNYCHKLSSGVICAAGTLGQIIPPSIVLILLGDVISSAFQQAQLDMGLFSPRSVSIGDLFAGALIPGLLLVCLYLVYLMFVAIFQPHRVPAVVEDNSSDMFTVAISCLKVLLPPIILIVSVLGSILMGLATPTEAASIGAVGTILLTAINGKLNLEIMQQVCISTMRVTSMVFFVFVGASMFALTFRGFGGDVLVEEFLYSLPGDLFFAVALVMAFIFLLGFILDFIEITYTVVPIVGPILLAMGIDPILLGILIAINLQTSFLTPPFGFSLFYFRGVAPSEVRTIDIYKGVIPFIFIQVVVICMCAFFPSIVTWLPNQIYGQ